MASATMPTISVNVDTAQAQQALAQMQARIRETEAAIEALESRTTLLSGAVAGVAVAGAVASASTRPISRRSLFAFWRRGT